MVERILRACNHGVDTIHDGLRALVLAQARSHHEVVVGTIRGVG